MKKKDLDMNKLREEVLEDLKKKGMRPSVNTDLNVVVEKGEFAGEVWRYVRVDRWELLDKEGNRRIGLLPNFEGGPFMVFSDKKGKVRMAHGIDAEDRPSLRMFNEDGICRLAIGLGPDGTPALIFNNKKGKPCFVLGPETFALGEDGKAEFQVKRGTDGIIRANLQGKERSGICFGVAKDGCPTVGLYDKNRRSRMGMTLTSDGSPELVLMDKKEKVIWQPEIAKNTKGHKKAKAA